jgi:hypothetical protein
MILDVRLPGKTGIKVLREVKTLKPLLASSCRSRHFSGNALTGLRSYGLFTFCPNVEFDTASYISVLVFRRFFALNGLLCYNYLQ